MKNLNLQILNLHQGHMCTQMLKQLHAKTSPPSAYCIRITLKHHTETDLHG